MRITSSSEGGNSYLLQLLSITRLAYFAASNENRILNSCILSKKIISSDRSSVVYPIAVREGVKKTGKKQSGSNVK